MALPIEPARAREILAAALQAAEAAYRDAATPLAASPAVEVATQRLFASATQAYREALLGCAVARLADPRIDVRLPSTESGAASFSGRSLADQVITPFLREHAIPCSAGPYLSSLRGGARFVPGGEPRIQRDKDGFAALVDVVGFLADAAPQAATDYLTLLLYRFVELREAGRLTLARIAKPNLVQLGRLIDGLLGVKSGGRFAALLATALFQTLSDCHGLGWTVDFQGINVADKSSGAVGDITVRRDDATVLGVEVTERVVDASRVTAIFEQKISPNSVTDYLIVTTAAPLETARAAARSYTAVGHEINFVLLAEWLVNTLATLGQAGRANFQAHMLALLEPQPGELKVAWNAKMAAAIGVTEAATESSSDQRQYRF